jgi:arylsulfatase A-like enzyme
MQPMFLYLPYQAVHSGNKPTKADPEYVENEAPQRYVDQYAWVQTESRRNLSAMVAVMDEAAANVTSALKGAGMWRNTLFIFSTDNGGPIKDPAVEQASNYPLKGGKAQLWVSALRRVGCTSVDCFNSR